MIDRDIHLARALLVESNPLLRSVAAAQLRDVGVGNVSQAARVKDARLLLERESFDIVVCNRELDDNDVAGQDLLDELRRENLLAPGTVFIMVTSQATYHQVVEAAEAALDGFLVRPYTAVLLGERIAEARARKRELAEILRALDAGQTQLALVQAIKRFQDQRPYAAWCGRLGAELLLQLGRADDARLLFEKLAAPKRAVWARLGIARAQVAAGDNAAARRTLAGVLQDEPGSADAHDLLGRILVEQCDFDGALVEYRAAAELTPGCLLRTQHAGALAFYQGSAEEALALLERAVGLGVQSKLFDALTLLLIGLLRMDRGNTAGVASVRDQLVRYRERFPDSPRLQRLEKAARVLAALAGGAHETALQGLAELSTQVDDDDFDLESASVLLALWARVPAPHLDAARHAALLERVGQRLCISKAIAEALVAAAGRSEVAVATIRRCQAQVSALSEQAMERALRGDPAGGVSLLLEAGERQRNTKLLELALQLVRRHEAALPDAAALGERAGEALRRWGSVSNHIAGIQRSGRAPGALQLRGRATAPAPAVANAA
ncbi:MAG: response regulator [Rubrivivax sp.]|nr:response regulator [Rubrivivax sp.]